MSAPDILFPLAAYFGAYLIPVLYLAGSLFRGRARKKLWWGMAIHTFCNLAVWGFVYYNWKEGYSDYLYAWLLLLPVNFVSAIYYLGAILWEHSRPPKTTFPAVPSLTSRCRGTGATLPLAGFRHSVWFPPSRARSQPWSASDCLPTRCESRHRYPHDRGNGRHSRVRRPRAGGGDSPSTPAGSTPAVSPYGLPTSGSTIVVWDDKRYGNEDIQAAIVGYANFGFHINYRVPVSAVAGDQKRPAVCRTEKGALVVWEDPRNTSLPDGPRDIYAARVEGAGVVTPVGGLPVAAWAGDESDVEIVRLDDGILAVWELRGDPVHPDGLYGARFSIEGDLIDAEPVLIHAGSAVEPALAGAGDRALMVYEFGVNGVASRLLRIDPGGLVVGDEVVLDTYNDDRPEPAVAGGGGYFLVAWADAPEDGTSRLALRRVGPEGSAIDAVPFVVGGSLAPRSIEVAARGPDAFVVLTAGTDPFQRRQFIFARLVSFDGAVAFGDAIPLDAGSGSVPRDPAIALGLDGRPGLLVWEEERDQGLDAGEEIHGSRYAFGSSVLFPLTLSSSTTSAGSVDLDSTVALPGTWGKSVAFRARGGDLAPGLFLSSPSQGPVSLGSSLEGKAFAASGRGLAWLTHDGFANVRLYLPQTGQPGISAFGFLLAEAVAITETAAYALVPVYEGPPQLWRETLPVPGASFVSAPTLVATLAEGTVKLAAVETGGTTYLLTGAASGYGEALMRIDAKQGMQVIPLPTAYDPRLVASKDGADVVWYNGDWNFLPWPLEAPAPLPVVVSNAYPRDAVFASASGGSPATVLWEQGQYVMDSGPPRWVNFLYWQQLGLGGRPLGTPQGLPTQGSGRPASGANQPLTYAREIATSPFLGRYTLELATLHPLETLAAALTGNRFQATWSAVAGSDVLVERSTDLRTWLPAGCLRADGNGTVFLPDQTVTEEPAYWKIRYALP